MDFLRQVKKIQKGKHSPSVSQSDVEDWGLVNVVLRLHQLEGVKWLIERYQRHHGCILGDEMGLGKTLQVMNNNNPSSAVNSISVDTIALEPLKIRVDTLIV